MLILDLPVEIFVDHLGALLRRDVGKQVGAQVPRDRDIVGHPGIARRVDEPRVESEQDMALDLARRDLLAVDVVALSMLIVVATSPCG